MAFSGQPEFVLAVIRAYNTVTRPYQRSFTSHSQELAILDQQYRLHRISTIFGASQIAIPFETNMSLFFNYVAPLLGSAVTGCSVSTGDNLSKKWTQGPLLARRLRINRQQGG